MFRYLQNVTNEPANAMCTASAAMVQGMGVVKETDTTVKFPTAATANDIYVVTRGRFHTGEPVSIPDYDPRNENIAEGEYVVLIKPRIGERFFTDQVGEVADKDYVQVGTDGKFEKVTAGNSNLQVKNANHMDCGTHKGVIIEVVDWAKVGD